MVKDSVEIMEQGACSGMAAVPIHYYDVDRMQEKTIESCQGDLTVMPRSWSLPARAAWESPWAVRSCFTFGPMMFLDVPFQ